MRFGLLVVLAVACGGGGSSEPVSKTANDSSNWHASTVEGATRVRVDPQKSWKDAASAIAGNGACADAVLVWGDLAVDASVHPRPVEIAIGDDAPTLSGFLICNADMEAVLKLQTMNPRFKAGHGGSADLKWRDGQLFLRRRWSAADIALGQLDPPPSDVFQRGEALAAIVSVDEASVQPAKLLPALARAPRVFVFAMFPLR
jgi:hypothetical protein